MRALVAMRGVAAKGQQRGADIVPGGHRRLRVAVVIAEHIAAHVKAAAFGQAQQVAREVIVVRAAGVLHGDAHLPLGGVLPFGHRGDVDADKLADIPRQRTGGAGADFFGDGKQRVAVNRQRQAAFLMHLDRRQQCRYAGFVVQMARADMAAVAEFGQRVEGHHIAHGNA